MIYRVTAVSDLTIISATRSAFEVRELGGVAVQRALDIDWDGNKTFGPHRNKD